jgi:hypothetical protein
VQALWPNHIPQGGWSDAAAQSAGADATTKDRQGEGGSADRTGCAVVPRGNVTITKRQRNRLGERADRLCEIRRHGCLIHASNAHHRKNRSQGGGDWLSNLLLACGSGTTGCHGYITSNPAEARRNGWTTWATDKPAEVPVLYRGQWVRLDDDGYVHILSRGEVRNELGHLHIGIQQTS